MCSIVALLHKKLCKLSRKMQSENGSSLLSPRIKQYQSSSGAGCVGRSHPESPETMKVVFPVQTQTRTPWPGPGSGLTGGLQHAP